MKLLVFFLLAVIFVSGCTSEPTDQDRTRALTACTFLCKLQYQKNATSLEDGPCIADDLQPDWVCDIAHMPRLEVDNLPQNQCASYPQKAHHFVELDEYCDLLNIL